MAELSDKQLAFVREYLLDFNATQAAIRAGYAPRSAQVTGARLISNDMVQKLLQAGTAKVAESNADLKQRIIDELKLLCFSDIGDFINWDSDLQMKSQEEVDPERRRCIESIQFTETSTDRSTNIRKSFKLHSKEKAIELLMRHLGMMNDKLALDLPEPVIITRRDGTTIELGAKKRDV